MGTWAKTPGQKQQQGREQDQEREQQQKRRSRLQVGFIACP